MSEDSLLSHSSADYSMANSILSYSRADSTTMGAASVFPLRCTRYTDIADMWPHRCCARQQEMQKSDARQAAQAVLCDNKM